MKAAIVFTLLISLILTACASGPADLPALPQEGFSPRTLYNLNGIDELVTHFNDQAGVTRLILLMSPT